MARQQQINNAQLAIELVEALRDLDRGHFGPASVKFRATCIHGVYPEDLPSKQRTQEWWDEWNIIAPFIRYAESRFANLQPLAEVEKQNGITS